LKEKLRRKFEDSKRKTVLEEVSGIFETEGFASVKMQSIADRLGMSVGALYKLFESKEALYHAYVAYQIERFYETFKQACVAVDDPRRRLALFVDMKFEVMEQKRLAIEESASIDALFFLKLHTRHNDPAEPIYTMLEDCFARLNEHTPLKESDMRKLAFVFNAYSTGYVEYALRYDTPIQAKGDEVVERFLNGIT
jgi:AcrR family transcriptional regulator